MSSVYVSLNENTMLKSVRAFLIDNNLKEIGEIIASFPALKLLKMKRNLKEICFYTCDESQNQEVSHYCE